MTATLHFRPGALVCGGRYRVVRVLAIGGMGSVYEAEDVSLGRRFVLKTLHRELAAEGELRAQMEREARVLGRIDHPNIVRIFTAGVTENDLPYIVMELLEGASLRDVLRTVGKLPGRAAVRATIEVLHALDHIHELGVVHCDIKPENIFLHCEQRRIVPKLLDFGVVRIVTRGEAAVPRGGTVRYASPEHVRGDAVGPRSDVYSMGLVLYEMLAGRSPFHGVSGAGEIIRAQLEQVPRAIAGIAPGLMSVLRCALEKDEALRPRDAFTFARTLREIEPLVAGDISLDRAVAITRITCDEATRRREDDEDTVIDVTSYVTRDELLTRASRPREEEDAVTDFFRTRAGAGRRDRPTRDTR